MRIISKSKDYCDGVQGISPEKEMPKIDDKSNLYRHGFDNWSFKKRNNK